MSPKQSAIKLLICATNLLVFTSASPIPTGYNYDHVGNYVNLENSYVSKPSYQYSLNNYPHPPQTTFQGHFGQDGPIHSVHHSKPINFMKLYENPLNFPSFQTILLIRPASAQQYSDSHGTEFGKVDPQQQFHPGFVLPEQNSMVLSEPTLPNQNVFNIPEVRVPSIDMEVPKIKVHIISEHISEESDETPDVPKIPEVVEVPEMPEVPEVPLISEIPEIPEIPEMKTEPGRESVLVPVPVKQQVQVPTEQAVELSTTTTTTEAPTTTASTTTVNTVINNGDNLDSTSKSRMDTQETSLDTVLDPFRPVSQDDAVVSDDVVTTLAPEDQPEEEIKERSLLVETGNTDKIENVDTDATKTEQQVAKEIPSQDEKVESETTTVPETSTSSE